MALNKVILYGRLTRDPEIRQTPSGVSCTRFSVAVDRQFTNKQTGERETDFIECTAWRNTAEFIARYFDKGSAIIVEGSLHNANWEKDGVKHYSYNVTAENVSFGGDKKQSAAPQEQGNAPESITVDNLSGFAEILSDGEVPF